MRTITLALLGLAAAAHGLPAREKRQFSIGNGDTDFCIGDCSNGGHTLTPGFKIGRDATAPTKRALYERTDSKHDVAKLYGALVELLKSKKPTFPVYMVAEQLVQLLLEEGFEFDPTILGAWSTFKVGKRQDGIFALPGSCNPQDVIGLETTLATILLIYGPSPPASIASLRNAVTAALIFCKAAPEPSTEITPEIPEEGGAVVPNIPEEGGSVVPDIPEEGEVEIEEPEEGEVVVEEPEVDFSIDEGEEGSIEIDEGEEGSIEIPEPEEGSIRIDG